MLEPLAVLMGGCGGLLVLHTCDSLLNHPELLKSVLGVKFDEAKALSYKEEGRRRLKALQEADKAIEVPLGSVQG